MESNIKQIQKVILMIAEEVTNICDKNNIEYSLDGGSLLGAVRHQGFIPWDDDFDIVIPRDQYHKFLQVAQKELPSNYFLQTEDNTPGYAFAFCKVLLNGTVLEETFSKTADVHHGIFVDIFPIDNLPDNKFIRKIYLLQNSILKNLIWVKCGYGKLTHTKSFKYHIYKIMGSAFNIKTLKKMRKNVLRRCNRKKGKLCFTADYPQPYRKWIWYKKFSNYKFENTKFKGLTDYEDYLTTIYGDYMKLPPLEERQVHGIKADLGKYSNL